MPISGIVAYFQHFLATLLTPINFRTTNNRAPVISLVANDRCSLRDAESSDIAAFFSL